MSMDEKHPNINYTSADLCHIFLHLLESSFSKICSICPRTSYDSIDVGNPKNQDKSIV